MLSTSPVLSPSSGEDSQLHLAVSTWTNAAGDGFHSFFQPFPALHHCLGPRLQPS